MYEAIILAVGAVCGLFLSKLMKTVQLYKYHKEVSDTLLRCLNIENDYAKALGKNSMIEYMIEERGLSYAVFYYGSIYHLLSGQYKKDEHTEKVEYALAEFLREAMHDEIEEYKRAKTAKNK